MCLYNVIIISREQYIIQNTLESRINMIDKRKEEKNHRRTQLRDDEKHDLRKQSDRLKKTTNLYYSRARTSLICISIIGVKFKERRVFIST